MTTGRGSSGELVTENLMTLVAPRAAFEKAVTDAVADADATVQMVYDNVRFTTPGKTKKYVLMSVSYSQSTIQTHGASSDFYVGTSFSAISMCPKTLERQRLQRLASP